MTEHRRPGLDNCYCAAWARLIRTLGLSSTKTLSSRLRSLACQIYASNPVRARSSVSIENRDCVSGGIEHAYGCHLATERGAAILSFRTSEDIVPFAFCGAVCCPANASATTGFMLSTIDVGIKIVAPRSLVVS